MGLLSRESAAGDLDSLRLKCCVGCETISIIASSVKVDLKKFLYNPEQHPL